MSILLKKCSCRFRDKHTAERGHEWFMTSYADIEMDTLFFLLTAITDIVSVSFQIRRLIVKHFTYKRNKNIPAWCYVSEIAPNQPLTSCEICLSPSYSFAARKEKCVAGFSAVFWTCYICLYHDYCSNLLAPIECMVWERTLCFGDGCRFRRRCEVAGRIL